MKSHISVTFWLIQIIPCKCRAIEFLALVGIALLIAPCDYENQYMYSRSDE